MHCSRFYSKPDTQKYQIDRMNKEIERAVEKKRKSNRHDIKLTNPIFCKIQIVFNLPFFSFFLSLTLASSQVKRKTLNFCHFEIWFVVNSANYRFYSVQMMTINLSHKANEHEKKKSETDLFILISVIVLYRFLHHSLSIIHFNFLSYFQPKQIDSTQTKQYKMKFVYFYELEKQITISSSCYEWVIDILFWYKKRDVFFSLKQFHCLKYFRFIFIMLFLLILSNRVSTVCK